MAEWMISSGILILLVIGVRRLMKNRISPLLQYALWLIVLVRLLLPFNLVNSGISVMNMVKPVEKVIVLTQSGTDQGLEVLPSTSAAGTENTSNVAATSQAQASEHTISLDFALRAAWLMGAAAILIIAAVINIRFSRHLQKHRSWLPGQPIRTYVVSGISSPCLYGIISPAIYITQDVAQDMTALQHVIAHEQAHYRHGDHIWSLLRIAALALHWYNPLVWWACALSKRDAEMAADDSAMRALGMGQEERIEYGKTLLRMLKQASRRDPLLSCSTTVFGTRRALRERITAIARSSKTAVSMVVIVCALSIFIIGCTFTGSRKDTLTNLSDPVENLQESSQTDSIENSNSDSVQESDSESSLEAGQENSNAEKAGSPYDTILETYYTAISEQWDASELTDAYLSYMVRNAYTAPEPLSYLGYAFLDIDGNGVDELLIGTVQESDEDLTYRMIYDLYTLTNDTPTLVFSGGDRNRFYLCSDGTIANEASNSAYQSADFYFALEGDTLVLKEGLLFDADYDGENPWFLTTNTNWDAAGDTPITEEEAMDLFKRYEAMYQAVAYTPFSTLH